MAQHKSIRERRFLNDGNLKPFIESRRMCDAIETKMLYAKAQPFAVADIAKAAVSQSLAVSDKARRRGAAWRWNPPPVGSRKHRPIGLPF